MQCKDISDLPILKFLDSLDRPGIWFDIDVDNTVRHVFPKDSPDKLVLAKMKSLIKRKLVDGCDCGCRGDYVITAKGKEFYEGEGLE